MYIDCLFREKAKCKNIQTHNSVFFFFFFLGGGGGVGGGAFMYVRIVLGRYRSVLCS